MKTNSPVKLVSAIILLTASMVLPQVSYAVYQDDVTGKVTQVVMHLDNWTVLNYNQAAILHIYVQGLPAANSGVNGCGTSGGHARVSVSSQNPAFKEYYAAALTARATGQSLRVWYLDSCSVRSNSWDLGILQIQD